MQIKQDDYLVNFNAETLTVTCSGTFRLTGMEYIPIMKLLNTVADKQPSNLYINLTNLAFLNSSGINTLCKFIMRLRKNNITQVKVIGNQQFSWQKKSLTNLKKILPSLELSF